MSSPLQIQYFGSALIMTSQLINFIEQFFLFFFNLFSHF